MAKFSKINSKRKGPKIFKSITDQLYEGEISTEDAHSVLYSLNSMGYVRYQMGKPLANNSHVQERYPLLTKFIVADIERKINFDRLSQGF